jgi:hypothetical protein
MVVEKEGNMLGKKGPNKKKKLKQLASYHAKFIKDGFSKDGVENIYIIHL